MTNDGMAEYPNWLAPTARAWRRRKRREWQAVEKALKAFNCGAAYTPAYKDGSLMTLNGAADAVKKTIQTHTWGD